MASTPIPGMALVLIAIQSPSLQNSPVQSGSGRASDQKLDTAAVIVPRAFTWTTNPVAASMRSAAAPPPKPGVPRPSHRTPNARGQLVGERPKGAGAPQHRVRRYMKRQGFRPTPTVRDHF